MASPEPERGLRPAPLLLGAALTLGALYVLLPAVTGLDDAWRRLGAGDKAWLAPAALAEVASFCGWVVVLRAILARHGDRFGWALSARITLAGVAATRLLATAGAGGIALTIWALRRLGVAMREAARDVATLLVALYAVYLLAILLAGAGLRAGILPGRAPASLTVVPAALAGGAMLAVVALALLSRLPRRLSGSGPMRWVRAIGTGPLLLGAGLRRTAALAARGDPGLLGAVGWWAFDVLALWCAFRAFGAAPPAGALLMGYLLGQLGNLLPLPGGVGGIDGAMIGSFIAFGVDPSLAVVAVLTYRTLAFWLPTVPGIVAYAGLRRQLGGELTGSGAGSARSTAPRGRRARTRSRARGRPAGRDCR